MGIGLRLCGLAAAAVAAGATATAVSGAVWTAPPRLPATTTPVAPVQAVPTQHGGGVIWDGDHDRSHCPGDDFGGLRKPGRSRPDASTTAGTS